MAPVFDSDKQLSLVCKPSVTDSICSSTATPNSSHTSPSSSTFSDTTANQRNTSNNHELLDYFTRLEATVNRAVVAEEMRHEKYADTCARKLDDACRRHHHLGMCDWYDSEAENALHCIEGNLSSEELSEYSAGMTEALEHDALVGADQREQSLLKTWLEALLGSAIEDLDNFGEADNLLIQFEGLERRVQLNME